MTPNPLRVVIDTNVLASAMVFGGKPEIVLKFAIKQTIQAVSSQVLIAELTEILVKKFQFTTNMAKLTEELITASFEIVYPSAQLAVIRGSNDNRVLEAAIEGQCSLIVTGDKDLLALGSYANIKIVTVDQLLTML